MTFPMVPFLSMCCRRSSLLAFENEDGTQLIHTPALLEFWSLYKRPPLIPLSV
jgi:hypothetical protein